MNMTSIIQRYAGWFQLLFVLVVVGAALLVSTSLKPESSNRWGAGAAPRAIPVSVVPPEATDYAPMVDLNGVVEARTLTNVVPQVTGRVVEVSADFRPGARFEAGDVLFRIEAADYELAVERTLAEIEIARADLARLEAEAEAERQIWNQQYTDREIPDLIARVPQIAATEARIHSGEAARAAAELELSRTVVRAPFAGRVLDTDLDIGQVVVQGSPVGSIFSTGGLEIAVPVSSEELALIGDPIGSAATIERVAGGTVDAVVVRKAAALDEQTRLGTLFLATEDAASLTLGEFVGVQIRGDVAPDLYQVPAASLTSSDQIWVVEDGVLREREVNVVASEGSYAYLRSFDVADGIVAIPPSDGRDGLPVEVRTAEVRNERRHGGGGGVAVGAN